MSDGKVRKLNRDELPWFYRLILKIPAADLLENISSGLFWAVVVPVFMVLEPLLALLLLLYFPFPMNIGMALIIPAMILLMFLRISLKDFSIIGTGRLKIRRNGILTRRCRNILSCLKREIRRKAEKLRRFQVLPSGKNQKAESLNAPTYCVEETDCPERSSITHKFIPIILGVSVGR
jgi:hypothetical protein